MKTKIIKTGLIFILFLGLLFSFWFALKPYRIARAETYLQEKTLLGPLKASILLPRSPQVHLELGRIYFSQKEYQKAKNEYEKALKLCNNCPELSEIHLESKKTAAAQAIAAGDIETAKDNLAAGIELNPKDPIIRFYYGVFLSTTGDYEEGLENLNSITKSDETENQRKILLSALEKILNFKSSIFNPDNPQSTLLVGTAFWQMGYDNLAIDQFEKTTKIDPEYRDAWIYLGKAYLQQSTANSQQPTINNQQSTEALNKSREALEKAAEIDPVYPETFYLLSQTYEKLKKPGESKKALDKAKTLGLEEK